MGPSTLRRLGLTTTPGGRDPYRDRPPEDRSNQVSWRRLTTPARHARVPERTYHDNAGV